jgi:outer membrane protein
MKKLSFAILSLFVLAVGPAVRAEENKIGTVDMQKALQTVDAGKKAKSQLEGEFTKKKTELQKEEAAIKKLHEEFQKQSLVMTEAARTKKEAEIRERVMKFQESTQRSQNEIQKKEQELTVPIIEKLRSVINGLAKSKGYSVVLEKNENTVLFSQEKDDLTKEVIEAYNKGNKS